MDAKRQTVYLQSAEKGRYLSSDRKGSDGVIGGMSKDLVVQVSNISLRYGREILLISSSHISTTILPDCINNRGIFAF